MAKKKIKRKLKKSNIKSQSGQKSIWKTGVFWKWALPLVIVTTIFFIPSLQNEFVNWDDDVNLLENENLDVFNAEKVGRIFSLNPEHSSIIGNYNPLPIFSFALEKHFLGLNPGIYHFNNLFLHLLCVLLVLIIVRKMNVPWIASTFTAALFAINPMRVESVAWVTERKDVLLGLFFFLAVLFYIKKIRDQKPNILKYNALIYVFFILALLSKIQAVSLPLSLLAVDYFFKRKIEWKLIIEKIPMFAISLAFGLLGVYFLSQGESFEDKTNFNIIQRLFLGGYSYLVYIAKSIIPYEMSPVYPYPGSFPWTYYLSIIPAIGLLYLTYVQYKKGNRAFVFGIVFFTVNVMFMLQVLGAGQGFIADRFTYIPYMGLFFIYGSLAQKWLDGFSKYKTAIVAAGAAYLLVMGALTWKQCKVWGNGETLWTRVLEHDSKAALPWGNRANYRRDNKLFDGAISDYNQAIRLKPNNDNYYNSRGKLYFDTGNSAKSIEDYERAISLDNSVGEYWTNLGNVLAREGRFNEALEKFNKTISLDSEDEDGYLGRSLLYLTTGNLKAAQSDYTKLVKINPYNPDIWFEKAMVGRQLGDLNKSMEDIDRAINLNGKVGTYFLERAHIFAKRGDKAQAKQNINTAQRLGAKPDAQLLKLVQ